MPVGPIPTRSFTVVLYNPLLAFIVALFFSLAVRSFILLIARRHSSLFAKLVGLLAAIVFLLLGWLDTLFASPQLVWDRPARATAAVTLVAVLLWTVARSVGRQTTKSHRFLVVSVKLALFVILLFTATLTLMRAGYIALVGDRVTLLVRVTGEMNIETLSWTPPSGPTRTEPLILHHVVIWLPTGEKAADVWCLGDAIAVHGTAIRFSPALRALRVPNLYRLEYIRNWYSTPERLSTSPAAVYPFSNSGPLKVHRWWSPIQSRLLSWWSGNAYSQSQFSAVTIGGPPLAPPSWRDPYLPIPGHAGIETPPSWWAIQMSDDESPLYPLVDADGRPAPKTYLLVLTTGGFATSRRSSPLEDKRILN